MTEFTQYTAAAVQYEPKIHGKAENTKHQLRMAAEAGKGGAKLIVLPEMNQVGYCYYSRDQVRPYVEPIPGPTTVLYAEVARRYETRIVVGLAEVNPETNNHYNAQALIGPDGLIGKYRKVHSYISEPMCSHDGTDISRGKLDILSGTLECPKHYAVLDVRSGTPLRGPFGADGDTQPLLRLYRIAFDSGRIMLEANQEWGPSSRALETSRFRS